MRARVFWFAVQPLLLAGCGGGGGGFSGIPAELLPNLRPQKATGLRIESTNTGSAVERVLRLDTRVANYGVGPMELFGLIEGADTGQPVPATQRIRWNNGDTTPLGAGEFHFHPQHGHWHWESFVSFKLANAVNIADPYDPANTVVGTNAKVSFCLLDSEKMGDYSGSRPSSPRYTMCSRNTQGISNGWQDLYGASLWGQWIVIEGLPDGQYWVILESDPPALLTESDETDNRSAVRIEIAGNSVTVLP